MYPGVEEDYIHPKLKHSTGHLMELDVFIESLKLAFEYQGKHHYKPLYWTGADLAAQLTRDAEKRIACGQVLEIVPNNLCRME